MIRSSKSSPAFTLIELMISIAMVVVLMLGITKVFSLTAQTAGATNQLSSFLRDSRAAQAVFYQDFSTAVSDGAPCMLLCSSRVSAFRNRADELGDRDYSIGDNTSDHDLHIRTIDVNGDNKEGDSTIPGEIIPTTAINNRSHRIDTFSFFSRQRLQRQTGGNAIGNPNTPLLAQMSANEAWIWYGHLLLPDNTGGFSTDGHGLPGAGTFTGNPNNFYASQWILGREAILLKQATGGVINDRASTPNPQAFIDVITPAGGLNWLMPLSFMSKANVGGASIGTSRYDLANTSISDFLSRWNSCHTALPNIAWWQFLFCNPSSFAGRFQAVPFTGGSITAQTLSQQAPIFLQGCSQFIVEYAGDYLKQDPTLGTVTDCYTNFDPTANGGAGAYVSGTTDGQIDFFVDAAGNKKVLWYGLPRDTYCNVAGNQAFGAPDGLITALDGDVVPLRDWWQQKTAAPSQASYSAPFEKQPLLPKTTNTTFGYAATDGTGMSPTAQYICAFGPSDPKPKMIRITMTLDDPSGTLPDGVTFQYVFTLP